MQSRLERKWWFSLPITGLAGFLTVYIMADAGIAHHYNFSQWLLYFLCFAGLQRGLSLLAWLIVLSVSPLDGIRERMR